MCMNYECGNVSPELTGYSDADLAGWHNGRSRTGWAIKLGRRNESNAMILWQCKLQVPVFDNTPDSEQAALMELGHSLYFYRNLADECGFKGFQQQSFDAPSFSASCHNYAHFEDKDDHEEILLSEAFCDNKPTIQRTENAARWKRNRKVHIRYRKCVDYFNSDSPMRIANLIHIPGEDNPADMWTKVDGKADHFYNMRMEIMNLTDKYRG